MSTRKKTSASEKPEQKTRNGAKKLAAEAVKAVMPAAKKAVSKNTAGKKTAARKTVIATKTEKKQLGEVPEGAAKVYPTGVPQRLFGTSNYDPIEEDDDFTHRVTYALKHPDGHLLRMHVASITGRQGAYILTSQTSAKRIFELNTLEEMLEYRKYYRELSPQRGDWNWPATVKDLSKYQIVCRTFRDGREAIEPVAQELM